MGLDSSAGDLGERSAVTADSHSSWSRRGYWQSADHGGTRPERRQ